MYNNICYFWKEIEKKTHKENNEEDKIVCILGY